jgi:hypothetical protein
MAASMANPKMRPTHQPGPPMTLGNMRDLGVQRLVASCLSDACRHSALIDVWRYPAETEIPYFKSRVVCAKCGGRGNKIDVRRNWKEQPPSASLTGTPASVMSTISPISPTRIVAAGQRSIRFVNTTCIPGVIFMKLPVLFVLAPVINF